MQHVQTLQLDLHHDLQFMKAGIVWVVERNSSLRTVVATDGNGNEWLDEDDRMKLTLYSARNEFLAQWMENPNAVPWGAWPENLAVAQITGPNTVFCILQALAPSLWAVVDE
jgi:hypothetical protein